MSNAERLGTLPSAPLVYVLAAVYFDAHLNLKSEVPGIQQALNATLPRFQKALQSKVRIGPGAPSVEETELYCFANATRTKGIVLTDSSLVYHATEYQSSASFMGEVLQVFGAVGAFVAERFVQRVALRYIDTIVLDEGETPYQFVNQGIGGIDLPNEREPKRLQLSSHHVMQEGQLVFRFLTGLQNVFMPADLSQDYLQPAKLIVRALEKNRMSNTALLDTDRFVFVEARMTAEQVVTMLRKLHNDVSAVFKAVASPYAMEKWSRR